MSSTQIVQAPNTENEAQMKKRRRGYDDAFKKSRNYQVYQQCILIALLSSFFDVVIKQPVKRSVVSLQMLRIISISSKQTNEVINVDEFVTQRCKEKYENDLRNISMKTAKRRYDTNRISELIHLLIDILFEENYRFSSKFTDGKNGAPVVETVNAIFTPDQRVFTKQDIITKGMRINQHLTALLQSNTEFNVGHNDRTLAILLNGK